MGTWKCENCGADRVVGRVICTYCKAPCSSELLEGAIACPSCRTLSTSDQQKCVACGVWIVVQCVFCAAVSPHTATACTQCSEIFAGAAERKARGEYRSSTEDEESEDEDDEGDGSASPELFAIVRTAAERFADAEEDEADDSLAVTVGDERVIVFVHEDSVTVWAAGSECSSDEEARALLVRAGAADWGRIFLGEPDDDGDESYQVEAWLPGDGLSVSLLRKVIVAVAELAGEEGDEVDEVEDTEASEESEESEEDDDDLDADAVEANVRAAAKVAGAKLKRDGESFAVTLSREDEDLITSVFIREDSVEIWSAVGTCGDALDACEVLREAGDMARLRPSIEDLEPDGLFLCVEAYVPRRGLSAELLVELFDEVATAAEALAAHTED
jgi:hypothetical protein